jgi:hypothetical protein
MNRNVKEKMVALVAVMGFVLLLSALSLGLAEKPPKRYIWCTDGRCIVIPAIEIKVIR